MFVRENEEIRRPREKDTDIFQCQIVVGKNSPFQEFIPIDIDNVCYAFAYPMTPHYLNHHSHPTAPHYLNHHSHNDSTLP
ncbi:MAG: hypothetical protein L0922_01510, partial [Candidatus Mariimomonas ferrooxydans]